jgi:mRNA-degrading endonuclease toxin of MazEF toxin-antitoxin module
MAQYYRPGNIINVDLGDPPREVQGHEQASMRPCVILRALPELKLAVVVPCTSREPKYSHFSVVKVLQSSDGLPKDSYILCHQIRTISFERVQRLIGTLDIKSLLKIKAVMTDLLDL